MGNFRYAAGDAAESGGSTPSRWSGYTTVESPRMPRTGWNMANLPKNNHFHWVFMQQANDF